MTRSISSSTNTHVFILQTGALSSTTPLIPISSLLATEDSLIFELPQNEKKIFKVKVRLTPMDVYTLEFWRKNTTEPLAVVNDVYFDMLEEVFTSHSGLYTRL